jgi:hypothetical protein
MASRLLFILAVLCWIAAFVVSGQGLGSNAGGPNFKLFFAGSGVILFLGALVFWTLDSLGSAAKKAAKYAQSEEGKREIKKARRVLRAMDKQSKDPLNIRDE